ncbi:MAG: XrtA system polysaccharide deacetylase [Longimicrobiaceae bacterium]
MIAHHFTVDVEEYFQVSAFEPRVPRESWDGLESRVVASMSRLLDILAEHEARGTFFVLGWIAERHPELVRAIAAAGHEVASHGQDHRRVTHQTPEEFRASVRRSKQVLEEVTGTPVLGFRAPSFSIVPGLEWALDVLLEEGYGYDSSLFPVRRRGYGYPGGQRDPYWIERPAGRLAEVPPATLLRWGMSLPAGGGAYFRLFPYGLVRAALLDSQRRRVPATFYIHPWELDPEQPRLAVPWTTRIRHYGGLGGTIERLRRLLGEFRFMPVASTVASL